MVEETDKNFCSLNELKAYIPELLQKILNHSLKENIEENDDTAVKTSNTAAKIMEDEMKTLNKSPCAKPSAINPLTMVESAGQLVINMGHINNKFTGEQIATVFKNVKSLFLENQIPCQIELKNGNTAIWIRASKDDSAQAPEISTVKPPTVDSKLNEHINRLRVGIYYPHKKQPHIKSNLSISLMSTGFDERSLRAYYSSNPVPDDIHTMIKDILEKQLIWDHVAATYNMSARYNSKLDGHIEILRSGIEYPHKEQVLKRNYLKISLKSTGFDEPCIRFHYLNHPVPDDFNTLVKDILEKQKLWSYVQENYILNSRTPSKLDEHIEKLRVGVKYLPKNPKLNGTFSFSLNSNGFSESMVRFIYLNNSVPNNFNLVVKDMLERRNLWNYFNDTYKIIP